MIKIDLTGKVALVTGGSGELGRFMIRTLSAAGADVVVHYHKNQAKADELVEEARRNGRKAMAVQADVTVEESVVAMRAKVTAALSAPDIIVNNSVIQYKWQPVLQQPSADYESQFRSSTLHNVLMVRTFVPAMIEKKWGRVIGINTECAMQCGTTMSAYVSGKRGMDGVLRCLAKEVGEFGVTVNQVAPGWTISDGHPDSTSSDGYKKQVPLKRRGTAQEIANVVVFLASDLASFITGAYVPVCGGDVMPAI